MNKSIRMHIIKSFLIMRAEIYLLMFLLIFSLFTMKVFASEKEGFDIKYFEDGYEISNIGEGKLELRYEDKIGIFDIDGNALMPLQGEIGIGGNFAEGLVSAYKNNVQDGVSYVGKYGFINEKGDVIVDFKYRFVSYFSEGLAAVVDDNGHLGYIDKTGREVIPCQFSYQDMTRGGMIDNRYDFHDGLARTERDGYYGFIDKTGREVIACQYDYAHDFNEGLVAVRKNGKYGFIDKDGKLIVDFIYDEVGGFSEGLSVVYKYTEIDCDGDGYEDALVGYIDKTGKEVIEVKYLQGGDFSEGLAYVSEGGNYMYINKSGEVVLPAKYKAASCFKEGLALVQEDDGRDGEINIFNYGKYIDKTGKVVIPFSADGDFLDGIVIVESGWQADEKSGILKNPLLSGEKIPEMNEVPDKSELMAMYSPQKIRVGRIVGDEDSYKLPDLEVYLINGHNYFKLRDVSSLAMGTKAKFSLAWDEEKRLISIEKGGEYTALDTDLKAGDGVDKKARLSDVLLEVDGKQINLEAYNIEGQNYFKIRDLGRYLDFGAYWYADEEEVVLEFN